MSQKEIKIYMKSTWGSCQKAKESLLQKGFNVVVHDLLNEPLSQEDILKIVTDNEGRMRGPIFTQDDEVIVFGNNTGKIEKLVP